MANFNFDNSNASNSISNIRTAAENQAENKVAFENAIQTLSGYFSGNVAATFMKQASQHATNLSNDTNTMIEIAQDLDNIRKQMLKSIEEQSK